MSPAKTEMKKVCPKLEAKVSRNPAASQGALARRKASRFCMPDVQRAQIDAAHPRRVEIQHRTIGTLQERIISVVVEPMIRLRMREWP
jgi:hypothetical protein